MATGRYRADFDFGENTATAGTHVYEELAENAIGEKWT